MFSCMQCSNFQLSNLKYHTAFSTKNSRIKIVWEHQRILYIDKSFIINVMKVCSRSRATTEFCAARPHTVFWLNEGVIYCHHRNTAKHLQKYKWYLMSIMKSFNITNRQDVLIGYSEPVSYWKNALHIRYVFKYTNDKKISTCFTRSIVPHYIKCNFFHIKSKEHRLYCVPMVIYLFRSRHHARTTSV